MNGHIMETSILFGCLSCTLFLDRCVCGTRTLKLPDFYSQQKLLIDHRSPLNSIPQQPVLALISKQSVCHICHSTLFMTLEIIHRHHVWMTCLCFGFPWCILRLWERSIHHPSWASCTQHTTQHNEHRWEGLLSWAKLCIFIWNLFGSQMPVQIIAW